MKLREFFDVVPKTVQRWAWVPPGGAVLIALAAAYETAGEGSVGRTAAVYGSAALVTGILVSVWLLCLGFVSGDARRRGMRSFLWVLVAALFPHLLGFLLYFVMRQPIAGACPECGMTVSRSERFCSWCGAAQGPVSLDASQGASR